MPSLAACRCLFRLLRHWFEVLQFITYNLFQHQSFVYTQLNDQTVLFLTTEFSISHLFVLNFNVKQFI